MVNMLSSTVQSRETDSRTSSHLTFGNNEVNLSIIIET